jgi:hypothetical protein
VFRPNCYYDIIRNALRKADFRIDLPAFVRSCACADISLYSELVLFKKTQLRRTSLLNLLIALLLCIKVSYYSITAQAHGNLNGKELNFSQLTEKSDFQEQEDGSGEGYRYLNNEQLCFLRLWTIACLGFCLDSLFLSSAGRACYSSLHRSRCQVFAIYCFADCPSKSETFFERSDGQARYCKT